MIESNLSDYDKYITTHEFNKFSDEILNEKLKQTNLATKTELKSV